MHGPQIEWVYDFPRLQAFVMGADETEYAQHPESPQLQLLPQNIVLWTEMRRE